jgi:hypothetical protein
MSNRQGETTKTYFRSDRFFVEGGKWYFTTRENSIEGPFDSKEDAEQELMLYVRRLEERQKFGLKP